MAAKVKSRKKALESETPNPSTNQATSAVESLGTEKASTGEAKPKKSKQEKREKTVSYTHLTLPTSDLV